MKTKNTRIVLLASALVVVAAVVLYFLQNSGLNLFKSGPRYKKIEIAKSQVRPVKITGEVVDAWCYASQTMGPGRGEGHKACALACSYGGVTMGILEDGTKDLYIAAKTKGYHGCNEMLIPYVAQKVTATGWVGDLGGCRLLKIDKVEPVINIDQKPEQKTQSTKLPE